MNEKLFQFIWEYALFDTRELYLQDGRPVTIIRQGTINKDAGPDFIGARIRINDTIWVGNIELHLKESDWKKHRHEANLQYQNIILHVVLFADATEPYGNFPVLSLEHKIKPELHEAYTRLMNQKQVIACAPYSGHTSLSQLTWIQWTDRLLHERWNQKLKPLQNALTQSKQDWAKLLYHQMARYFGAGTNTQAFLHLAEQTPFTILSRHRNNLSHLEAILFGQAGLLPQTPEDPYSIELSIHYAFYKQKYGLVPMQGHEWKFLRMRPAHFPTVRIAQFAMLIHLSQHLFTQLIETDMLSENSFSSLLQVSTSDYWNNHYVFEKTSVSKVKKLGNRMVQNLIINVIIPIRMLYAQEMSRQASREQLSSLLSALPPEQNHITKQWQESGFPMKDAYTSQALLQLYEQYCSHKRCLQCTIGLHILKR